jgi:hypothetical protein
MNLQSTQEMIKEWKKELSEKVCPVIQGPCVLDKCWRFKKDELTAWPEETATRDPLTKRVNSKPTGKVILGTLVECLDSMFPGKRALEARYALQTEAKLDLKTMEILKPDGSPYGGIEEDQEIMSIEELDKDEDKELEDEMEMLEEEKAPKDKSVSEEEDDEIKRLQSLQDENLD